MVEKMSDIRALGGEFALIERIAHQMSVSNSTIVGIGDDCAVLPYKDNELLLVTTDMLVDDDHFSLEWASPLQIGIKAAEANLSDIAAMGGNPRWAFVALALTDSLSAQQVEEIYKGLKVSFDRVGVSLAGGDTTHSSCLTICLTLLGTVQNNMVRKRSDAKVGDVIGVSGTLGKSWAGLELFRAGRQDQGDTSAFLEPRCRLDLVDNLVPKVHAMIDVSDGLASEVRHICNMSNVGARVYKSKIPLSEATKKTGVVLGKDPYLWALSGGEDFELVFTTSKEEFAELKSQGLDICEVGEITPRDQGLWLYDGDERTSLPKGYDHFKR